jgi:hypothetical protein
MAAPINVSYTPQVTGDHIICYQQIDPVNDGANFCCMLDTTPSTPGVPKVFQIPDVMIPSCDYSGTCTPYGGILSTTFNGYVAPVCNTGLQTPWTAPVVFLVV